MAYWLLSSIVACIPVNVSLRLEEITNYHETVRNLNWTQRRPKSGQRTGSRTAKKSGIGAPCSLWPAPWCGYSIPLAREASEPSLLKVKGGSSSGGGRRTFPSGHGDCPPSNKNPSFPIGSVTGRKNLNQPSAEEVVSTSCHAPAEAQLRELDAFLEGQLDRYYRSGRKIDSHFIKAMDELHSVLGLGLRLMGWRKKCLRARTPANSSNGTESRANQPPSPQRRPSMENENEYLLKYDHELSCLHRLSQVRKNCDPVALRQLRAPGCEGQLLGKNRSRKGKP